MLKREEWGRLNFNFVITCLNTKMCTIFKTKHDLHNRGYFLRFFRGAKGSEKRARSAKHKLTGKAQKKINNTNNKKTENRIQ